MITLNIDSETSRVLSAAKYYRYDTGEPEVYVPEGMTAVESLPDGDISDYLYKDGEFIYDPLPKEETTESTAEDTSDAEAELMETTIDHELRLSALELAAE